MQQRRRDDGGQRCGKRRRSGGRRQTAADGASSADGATGSTGTNASCAAVDTSSNTSAVVAAANTLLGELTSAQKSTIQLDHTRYPSSLTYPTGTTGRGVAVGSLSAATQALVKTAIEAWVDNAAEPVATALLAEYESDAALAETYVAYSGSQDLSTKNSYFRIDGPRVRIEYTIQGGIVYQNRVHYHTIWRDKAADYGAEFASGG